MKSKLYYDPEFDCLLLLSYVDNYIICDVGLDTIHVYPHKLNSKLNLKSFILIDNNF